MRPGPGRWLAAALVVGLLVTGWYGGAWSRSGVAGEAVPPQLTADEWLAEGGTARAMFGWQFASCTDGRPTADPDRADHCYTQVGLGDVRPWAEDDRQFQSGVQRYQEFHGG